MCSKRLLEALTAIFALFVLAGCGGLSSVNEEDYYPRFEIKADNISHDVYRDTDVKECENDLEAFKNKGDYYEDLYSVTRDNPLGDGAIEKAETSKDCYSYSHIYLNILGDNITRNNELFEKVFGYKGGKLREVYVTKYFSENSVISYFETYGKLLEQQGFKKLGHNFWEKKDYKGGIIVYEWIYDISGDSQSPHISATWNYHPMDMIR
jgi:hypothetical protein